MKKGEAYPAFQETMPEESSSKKTILIVIGILVLALFILCFVCVKDYFFSDKSSKNLQSPIRDGVFDSYIGANCDSDNDCFLFFISPDGGVIAINKNFKDEFKSWYEAKAEVTLVDKNPTDVNYNPVCRQNFCSSEIILS